jgi:hypothetical protein
LNHMGKECFVIRIRYVGADSDTKFHETCSSTAMFSQSLQ